MINNELLHKFFKSVTTVSEEIEIKKWIEEAEENKQLFLQERKLFDSVLLNNKTLRMCYRKR